MERTFIQSALFGTAILVVYALISPPQTLSAQSSAVLDPREHVRKGTIVQIDAATNKFVIDVGGISVSVTTDASTTVSSPNGEDTELSFLRDGSGVYVFGDYDSQTHSIQATKIVMRNASILSRKSPSRAQVESMRSTKESATSSVFESLGLTAK